MSNRCDQFTLEELHTLKLINHGPFAKYLGDYDKKLAEKLQEEFITAYWDKLEKEGKTKYE